jgi:methyl-accepting chemotaxis protein
MSDFEKQCITLFVNHPLDWRNYLGCFNNPRYADRVISNLITHDKGIEFEIGSDIYDELKRVHKRSNFKRMTFANDGNEVQIRINQKSIRALYDLYRFLSRTFLEDYRQIRSGIHIHSDLGVEMSKQKQDYLSKKLDDFVDKMARCYFHYTGSYNRNEFSTTKGFSMIYRKSFKTIEYRCIKMTWSFKELLLHLILTEKLTNYIRANEKPEVGKLFKILNEMINLKESIINSDNDALKTSDSIYSIQSVDLSTDISEQTINMEMTRRIMEELRETQYRIDVDREIAEEREIGYVNVYL